MKKVLLWGLFAFLLAAFAALQFIPAGTTNKAEPAKAPPKAAAEAKNLGSGVAEQ